VVAIYEVAEVAQQASVRLVGSKEVVLQPSVE